MNSRTVRFQQSNLYLGLTQSEWLRFGLPIAAIALTTACFVPGRRTWLIVGLFFSLFVCVHLILTNSRYIVLPGFSTFIACGQLIVAPCLSYYYPPVSNALQFGTMAVDMDSYFSFASPATIALWLGLHLLISKRTQHAALINHKTKPLERNEQLFMDGLIAFGTLLSLIPIGLGFFAYVLAQLRFVGAMSWMLTETKRWEWRIGWVLFSLLLQVASGGVFYELILWGAFILGLSRNKAKKWRKPLQLKAFRRYLIELFESYIHQWFQGLFSLFRNYSINYHHIRSEVGMESSSSAFDYGISTV